VDNYLMSDGYWDPKIVNEYPLHLVPTLRRRKSDLINNSATEILLEAVGLLMEDQIPRSMEADVTNIQNNGPPPTSSSSSANSNCDQGAVDFVLEHGPGICATVEECRTTLLTVGANKITPGAVARIMIGMIKAHELHQQNQQNNPNQSQQNVWGEGSSGSSSKDKDKDRGGSSGLGGNDSGSSSSGGAVWNGKVFVQAVLEFVPNFIWKDVFRELDFPGFFIPDGRCFRALIDTLKYGLQLQGQNRPDQFPLETFLRRWTNTDGQLSLIRACLNAANCDIFSFADYPFHPAQTDMLKTNGDKSYDVKEITVWKSMELLDLLLNLSDGGHYPVIQEIFQFPIAHCPDILILGLIQIQSPMNVLHQDLLSVLFPVFLGNHINSGVILQYAWNNNGNTTIRPIMIHAMAEWYLRGDYDQTKLSRILDVAQDLKALPLLLNASSHVFIIDLACLASRREFLKLDKWLSDKIREHGEPFLASVVKVLNRRVPFLFGKEENIPKANQLPLETVGTMMQCLHQCSGKVSHELNDTLVTMVNAYQLVVKRGQLGSVGGGGGGPQQQPPPGVLRPQQLRTINTLEAAFSVNPSPGPGQQLFSNQVTGGDPLAGLGSTFGGLNLSGGSSTGVGGGGGGSFGYNPLGPTPGSPSRLLGPGFNSQNPAVSATAYPMISGLQQLGPNNSGTGSAAGGPNVAAVSAALMSGIGGGANPMGMLGRLGPNPQGPAGGGVPSTVGGGAGPGSDKRTALPDNTLLFADSQGEISKEAEDEANNYFHRIYSKPPVSE